jgi:hypothetical protein
VPDCVQIDITQFHRKLIENHAIIGHSQPLNRTPVGPEIKFSRGKMGKDA